MKRIVLVTLIFILGGGSCVYSQFLDKLITKAVSKSPADNRLILHQDDKGKIIAITQNKKYKKEKGIINNIKVINHNELNYIFDYGDITDYSGIQAFPCLTSDFVETHNVLNIKGTLLLPDAVIIDGKENCKGYFSKSHIEKVVFSPSIKRIGYGAFYGCDNLTEIEFQEGCNNIVIEDLAFGGCKNLQKITLPTNLTLFSVSKNAFTRYPDFVIKVPKGKTREYAKITGFDEKLFVDDDVSLDYNIEVKQAGTILNYISQNNLKRIRSLKITGFLDENDFAVIKNCTNLASIDLSDAFTALSEKEQKKKNAGKEFALALVDVYGEGVEEMKNDGDAGLVETFHAQMLTEAAKEERERIKEASVGCYLPEKCLSGLRKLETVIMPSRAFSIGYRAFDGCENLKSVKLPPYLKYIEGEAFLNCKKIKEINIPSSLLSCNTTAFDGCESITKIDFSKCVFKKKEGTFSFRKCVNLKELRLPEGIEIIKDIDALNNVTYYMPKSLVRFDNPIKYGIIYFKTEEPPSGSCPQNSTIYVPKGSMTKYYAKFNKNENVLREIGSGSPLGITNENINIKIPIIKR